MGQNCFHCLLFGLRNKVFPTIVAPPPYVITEKETMDN
jgi:hypothetical protein